MRVQWLDTDERFGAVTRALHWGMAALFGWQFFAISYEALIGETTFARAINSLHSSFGALILLLAVLRVAWGLMNRARRPAHRSDLLGRAATAGQIALYALMLIVPGLALLRSYASGRGFSPFGFELFAATGERISWMTAPASLLHGPLAWLLLALIGGHIAMVLVHRFLLRDATLTRMAGIAR